MSDDRLLKLASIPRAGSHPFDSRWPQIEESFGVPLPGNYKTLIDLFGASIWADFLHVLSTFDEQSNLKRVGEQVIDADRTTRSSFPSRYPLPLYPESGGLLPWAVTDNGDTLYFITNGAADDWPTLIKGARAPEFEVSFLPSALLVHHIVAGSFRSAILPEL